MFLIFIKPEC